ncbi:fumarylacetoacetate hydrolase family protein [Bradyrhizobium sp. Ash2021]|uniref:fumarylacetoacetate hydrolase family protein n=1 Tax=Bradyrhizobium sp. Ash2021 TaxID=2954771 RepID=UPI002814F297|nr:fumarylacetoacetate hydrolase family protein [Bradyrhizobium sp. Ash2021]WMT76426.1 fumarylacetoacetate hydrolase family protein [Bradyrhizobium sp. Ash2021]WMT76440.1 fumarylacetoacetate hydrolase family protein [Bradyrhizobium sp. Ash2021]
MNVLEGNRIERRRVLHGGSPQWAVPASDGLRLDDGRVVALNEVKHLPPCRPTKILCVHTNYMSRYFEVLGKTDGLQAPTFFQKPLSAINNHDGEIGLPDGYKFLNYEGELAAIVGRPMRNVAPEQVWDCLAGFTVANDVSLHDMRDADMGGMVRVKGADGFCPLGPGIVRGLDVRQSTLRTYLNGGLVQESPIAEMIFGIDYLIADLARHITLEAGDVILTGTPANSRPMTAGDVVEVEITGVGRLRNTVQPVPAPRMQIGHQPQDNPAIRSVALGNDERLPAQLRRGALTR